MTQLSTVKPRDLRHRRAGTQLQDDILQQIENGGLQPFDAILPIEALSKQYGIAKRTAHAAVRELVRQGVLNTRRGRGTFVSGEKKSSRRLRVVVRLSAGSTDLNRGMRLQLERFNSEQREIEAVALVGKEATIHPEIVVIRNEVTPPPLFCLETFQGFAQVRELLHPRFLAEDVCRPGPVTTLPVAAMLRCMSINRDVPGFEDRPAPKTWDEVLSWAKEAATIDGLTAPTFMTVSRTLCYTTYLAMCGCSRFTDPDTHELLVTPSNIQRWFDFVTALKPYATRIDSNVAVEPILSGRYLFNLGDGPWVVSQAERVDNPPRFSLHPAPTPEAGQAPICRFGFRELGIVRKEINESQKAACWEVIRYLLSSTCQSAINEDIGVLPVSRALCAEWAADPFRAVWPQLLATAVPRPSSPTNDKLEHALNIAFYHLHQGLSAKQATDLFFTQAEAVHWQATH